MSATLIICGVDRGATKAYRCPCCGYESDDLEAFATSACWACAFGSNGDCANCLRFGVEVSKFDPGWWLRGPDAKPRGRVHILRSRTLTRCGYRIPREVQTGGGSHDDARCRRCYDGGGRS